MHARRRGNRKVSTLAGSSRVTRGIRSEERGELPLGQRHGVLNTFSLGRTESQHHLGPSLELRVSLPGLCLTQYCCALSCKPHDPYSTPSIVGGYPLRLPGRRAR